MKKRIDPDKLPAAFEVIKKSMDEEEIAINICGAFIWISVIVMYILSHNLLYLLMGSLLTLLEVFIFWSVGPSIIAYYERSSGKNSYIRSLYNIKDYNKFFPNDLIFPLPIIYYKEGYWENNFISHFLSRVILFIAIVILLTDGILSRCADYKSVITVPLYHLLRNKPKDKDKISDEKEIFIGRIIIQETVVGRVSYNIVLVREYGATAGQLIENRRRNYWWNKSLKEFVDEKHYLLNSDIQAEHLDGMWGMTDTLVCEGYYLGNKLLLNKSIFTELLPDVKLIELKTTLPTNWNGRFVVVPMDYFSAGQISTFAQVLARAKRLGLEFLNETDKEVVKQSAEFRDKNSLTDKNDYWLGMKPEIVDKKLAMNLVNDIWPGMRCSKLDNSYLTNTVTFEKFIFKVPKDLDAKILAERLRTKAWQNRTNDNEFASWFVEPKEPPPQVEHRQSSRSSEYDGLEDWEIAEIKEAKKNKEIRQGINNAVSPVSSDLQSVKIKSPFAEDEKPTHYRRVDSTLCDMPKK